jgi:ABC-2 type transport system permease protein
MTFAQEWRVVRALSRRALNEILRVPGGAIPGVLAPAIFFIGLAGVFGSAVALRGFPGDGLDDFRSFILPVGMLQGAGFTGAATGVNLARDIERGWFDRLLVAPVRRPALLVAIVASACLRALLPATFLLVVGLILGVNAPSIGGLLIAYVLVMGLAAAGACWGTTLALRFRTQQAAPLIQVVMFASILFSTAYAPEPLLAPWLQTIADLNPVRYVLEGVRQAFVGGVDWTTTWHALVAVLGVIVLLGALAVRGMRRQGR